MKFNSLIHYIILSTIFAFIFSCQKSDESVKTGIETLPQGFQEALKVMRKENFENPNPTEVLRLMSKLEKEYPKNKFPQVQANIDSYRSLCFNVMGESNNSYLDSSLFYAEKAYLFYKTNQKYYKGQYVGLISRLAFAHRGKGSIEKASSYAQEALYLLEHDDSFSKDPKYATLIVGVYEDVAVLHEDDLNFQKARIYRKKALDYMLKPDVANKANISRGYLYLGLTYEKDFPDSSLYYIKKCVQEANQNDSLNVFLGHKNLGEIYLSIMKYDSSLKYLNKALTYNSLLHMNAEQKIYSGLMVIYNQKGESVLANKYYNLIHKNIFSKKRTKRNYSDSKLAKSLLTFASKNKINKDIDTLVAYYMQVSDTLYSIQKAESLKDLEIRYQVKAKDDNFQKLKVENDIKEAELKQRTLIFSIILLFLILGILTVYFINRQRQLRQEKEKAELQQRFLRSQMNPHFMSNALSAIQNEILEGNSKLANQYLNKYAQLTRLIFENSQAKYISIYNEVRVIENYLLLQKIRFADKFDYTLILYSGIEHDFVKIPPMLIQPSIENAIEHGFKNINYKGNLMISIKKEDEHIFAIVQDNGKGMNVLSSSDGKKSLSSSITEERLNMLAKETKQNAGITVEDVQPQGVSVTIIIPFIY